MAEPQEWHGVPAKPSYDNPLCAILELGGDQRYDFVFKDGQRTEFQVYDAEFQPEPAEFQEPLTHPVPEEIRQIEVYYEVEGTQLTRAIRMLDHNQAQVLKTEKYWDDDYEGIQGKTSTLSKTDRIVGV